MATFVQKTKLQTVEIFFFKTTGSISPFLDKFSAADGGDQIIR